MDPDFPLWLRATHLINFVLIGILLRSGWEIIASLPRLWWRNDCAPGTEWIRFTSRKLPKEPGVYTSLMDEKSLSPIIGLPGRENIGLARHWHGFGVMLWVLNGIVYVALLLGTGLWRRIVPTSWDVFPEAWHSFTVYAGFGMPSVELFTPYDALQKLAYTGVIFVIAPLMILTGLAMSPAIRGRFPWYLRLWGGYQKARSLHFLGMFAMCIFIVIHVGLVFIVHPEHNLPHMVFGADDPSRYAQAFTIAVLTVAAVIALWIALSYLTLANRPAFHRFLVSFTEIGRKLFLNRMRPVLSENAGLAKMPLSQWHWTNGLPPTDDESPEWIHLRDSDWDGWTLTVADRLNGTEKTLTLDELKALPRTDYVATHTCMQGWSATSKWSGVRLSEVLGLLGPRPEGADYVMVESFGLAQKMVDNRPREPFYAVIPVAELDERTTILAYERNGNPIEEYLGAPVRLRVESNHGYKHVKWVKSVSWIHDYAEYGDGRGGTREDSAFQAFNGRI